jgi:hypothetical protein
VALTRLWPDANVTSSDVSDMSDVSDVSDAVGWHTSGRWPSAGTCLRGSGTDRSSGPSGQSSA